MKNNFNWAFFGTDDFSIIVLDQLKEEGFIPSLVVTTEDKPKGRKMLLTKTATKVWAEKENIKYLELKTLKTEESFQAIKNSSQNEYDFFIVASYGKIIPQNILDLPKYKTLNVHPSLLPKLRGPSPVQTAILEENETGVSIMRLDSEMDHGPLLVQEKIDIEWPPYEDELEKISAKTGAKMLARVIPDFISGKIKEVEQDHSLATICKKIEKSDAEIDLTQNPETALRKIRAFNIWPGAFFFDEHNGNRVRIIVKKAHLENNNLVIERIVPEGKKEMDYSDYLRGKK